MKIAICGSMSFASEMLDTQAYLEQNGHVCLIPHDIEESLIGTVDKSGNAVFRKIHLNLIRRHYEKIKEADAVLILNIEKNGIVNYIGANTFLEMGFALVLNKTIFLFNPLPDNPFIRDETESMMPIILNGSLKMIGKTKIEREPLL